MSQVIKLEQYFNNKASAKYYTAMVDHISYMEKSGTMHFIVTMPDNSSRTFAYAEKGKLSSEDYPKGTVIKFRLRTDSDATRKISALFHVITDLSVLPQMGVTPLNRKPRLKRTG